MGSYLTISKPRHSLDILNNASIVQYAPRIVTISATAINPIRTDVQLDYNLIVERQGNAPILEQNIDFLAAQTKGERTVTLRRTRTAMVENELSYSFFGPTNDDPLLFAQRVGTLFNTKGVTIRRDWNSFAALL